jgi:hypothetical protein
MEELKTEKIKPNINGEEMANKGYERNPDGTIKSGVLNPKGRRNAEGFVTKFRKFIAKLAEQNETSPDEVIEQLYKVAFKRAQGGDYSFYKDILDRLYGKPVQPTEDLTADNDIRDTIDGVKELIKRGQKNEPQTDTKNVQSRGETSSDSTEIPTSV